MRLSFFSMSLAVVVLSVSAAASQPGPPGGPADQWLTRPVDDRTFKTYLEFFTYDRALPMDTRVSKTEESDDVRTERLSFQSTPGVRVTAVLKQPLGHTPATRPAVLVLHGGTSPGKDGPGPTRLMDLLARAGWTVLAIDMPHFGERTTDLLVTFSEQEKHERLYNQPSTYLTWMTLTRRPSGPWNDGSLACCCSTRDTSTPLKPTTCPLPARPTTSGASRRGACS